MSLMNKRVCHASRNLSMRYKQLVQIMEREGTFVWVVEGETFRDASASEIARTRKRRQDAETPLPIAEIHGLKFVPPATTRYRAPHEAFERFVCGLDTPTPGMRCHWPPEAAKYAESCA